MKKNIIVGCIISSVFIFFAVRGINFSEVIENFRSANYRYVIPIVLLMVVVLFLRSYRWGIILEPRVKYPQWPLFTITAIGFMSISLLPARLGEFIRPLLVKQKSGVRISSTMATIVVERMFDLLTLMLILCLVILNISLPPEIFKTCIIVLVMVLVIFFVLLLLVLKKEFSQQIFNLLLDKLPAKIGTALKNQLHAFIEGLEILPDVKKIIYVALISLLIWGALGLSCYMLFFSFGFNLPFIAAYAVTLMIAIGVMIPAAPGFIGTYHSACITSLALYSIPKAAALSYAIVLHFLQLIPTVVIGLLLLSSQKISLPTLIKKEKAEITNEGLQ
jgi:glycosyltransferase 2 family protein